MNPTLRLFFESMLTRNIAFTLFFGALLPVVAGLTIKQSFVSGLKHAIALLFSTLAAAALFAVLPDAPAIIDPALVFLLTLLTLRTLQAWGELNGEWGGIPHFILAFVPYAGCLLYFRAEELSGLPAVSAAFGTAAGFYLSMVIITALIEQLRISEAPEEYKRIGTLFFGMALFALAFAGFQFL